MADKVFKRNEMRHPFTVNMFRVSVKVNELFNLFDFNKSGQISQEEVVCVACHPRGDWCGFFHQSPFGSNLDVYCRLSYSCQPATLSLHFLAKFLIILPSWRCSKVDAKHWLMQHALRYLLHCTTCVACFDFSAVVLLGFDASDVNM